METRQIMFIERGKVELCTFPAIEPVPGRVLLEMHCTLVSRGTERDCLLGLIASPKYPMQLGYSGVATVLDNGGCKGFKAGDRVAVYHSTHSSHMLKEPEDLVVIEDDALPDEEAVFSIVGSMGLQGLRKCRLDFGESVVVMGQGLLGAFAAQCARINGAFPLIVLDFNAIRRQRALDFGVDYAFSPNEEGLSQTIRELTRGGANAVVEVTGNPNAVKQALTFTAEFGRVALTGCSRTPTEVIDFYHDVHRPGITIIGAHNFARPKHDSRPGYWTMREDMRLLLRMFSAKRLQVKPFISEVVPPEQCKDVFKRLVDGSDPNAIGSIFRWK